MAGCPTVFFVPRLSAYMRMSDRVLEARGTNNPGRRWLINFNIVVARPGNAAFPCPIREGGRMADLAGAPPGTRLCAHARRTAARARMSRSELEVLWDMPVHCNPTAAAAVLRRSCPEPLQYSLISVPQPPQETGHFPFQNGRGTVQNHPAGVVGGAASGFDASAVAANTPRVSTPLVPFCTC